MKENSFLDQVKQLTGAYVEKGDRNLDLEGGISKLSELTLSSVFLVDRNANLFTYSIGSEELGADFDDLLEVGSFSGDQNLAALLKSSEDMINETYSGKSNASLGLTYFVSVFPIKDDDEHLATILLIHQNKIVEEEIVLFIEISLILTGQLIMGKAVEYKEMENRSKELAVIAFESLSYSEVEAVQEILKNIEGSESIVVASKIADSLGITRSVIVNALRKFESAGVIESRSLGMKGTLIRVLNNYIFDLVDTHATKFRDYL